MARRKTKTRMRSHMTAPIGLNETGKLPNVKPNARVGSEVNNIRNFASNGRASEYGFNTNYPFFNYLKSRMKRGR